VNFVHDTIAGLLADTYFDTVAYTTRTRVTTDPVRGTHHWKLEATGDPSIEAQRMSIKKTVSIINPYMGTPAAGHDYVYSLSLKAEMLGTSLSATNVDIYVTESGVATPVTSSRADINVTNTWQRHFVSHTLTQSGVTGLTIEARFSGPVSGYAYVDCIDLTYGSYIYPHCDGYMSGCEWETSVDASPSWVGTPTIMTLDTLCHAVNGRNNLTIRHVTRIPFATDYVPYSANTKIYIFDMARVDGSGRMYLMWDRVKSSWILYAHDAVKLTFGPTADYPWTLPMNSDSEWIDIAVSIDGDNDTVSLVVNGLVVSTSAWGGTALNVEKWKFGDVWDAPDSSYSVGQELAELSVFGSALSGNELAAIYRLNTPLVDMGSLVDTGGLHFALTRLNESSMPVIIWADGEGSVKHFAEWNPADQQLTSGVSVISSGGAAQYAITAYNGVDSAGVIVRHNKVQVEGEMDFTTALSSAPSGSPTGSFIMQADGVPVKVPYYAA
jgi:hypothetical protein